MVCSLEEAWNLNAEPQLLPWNSDAASDEAEFNEITDKDTNGGTDNTSPTESFPTPITKPQPRITPGPQEDILLKLLPAIEQILASTADLKSLSIKLNAGLCVVLFVCFLFVWDVGFRYGQWYSHRYL